MNGFSNLNSSFSYNMNQDEKLIFNLNILGTLQENDKLTQKNDLLCIDESYPLIRPISRMLYNDNRYKSANAIKYILKCVEKRVDTLVDNNYEYRCRKEYCEKSIYENKSLEERKKSKIGSNTNTLLSKYKNVLQKARQGIDAIIITYSRDKYAQNMFKMIKDKVEEIISHIDFADKKK